MTVEGVSDELYTQNMEYRHQYDEIMKHFGEGQLIEAGAIQKDLQLHKGWTIIFVIGGGRGGGYLFIKKLFPSCSWLKKIVCFKVMN